MNTLNNISPGTAAKVSAAHFQKAHAGFSHLKGHVKLLCCHTCRCKCRRNVVGGGISCQIVGVVFVDAGKKQKKHQTSNYITSQQGEVRRALVCWYRAGFRTKSLTRSAPVGPMTKSGRDSSTSTNLARTHVHATVQCLLTRHPLEVIPQKHASSLRISVCLSTFAQHVRKRRIHRGRRRTTTTALRRRLQ